MVAVSDNELRLRLRFLLEKGWIEIPDQTRYRGTGGPGKLLEDELSVDGGNDDLPDSGRWELKYHSGKSLLTLFHKEASPKDHMRRLIQTFGWPDNKGRLNFRHTIGGTTGRGFFLRDDAGHISICNQKYPDTTFAHWTHDTIINAFVAKLRHLVVVKGERNKNYVRYNSAHFFREPQVTNLIEAISSGLVLVDFDAREELPPKTGLRNHGTKFRIKFENLRLIYHHIEGLEGLSPEFSTISLGKQPDL